MLHHNGVKEGLAVFDIGNGRAVATLNVLYHQDPDPARNVPFIEVREWVTVGEDSADLVAEWGVVNGDDDLETQSAVLDCGWGLAQALTFVNEQLALARV